MSCAVTARGAHMRSAHIPSQDRTGTKLAPHCQLATPTIVAEARPRAALCVPTCHAVLFTFAVRVNHTSGRDGGFAYAAARHISCDVNRTRAHASVRTSSGRRVWITNSMLIRRNHRSPGGDKQGWTVGQRKRTRASSNAVPRSEHGGSTGRPIIVRMVHMQRHGRTLQQRNCAGMRMGAHRD